MNINEFATNLELIDGVWYSKTHSAISYPEEANDECFQVEDKSFWFRHRNNCILELVKLYGNKKPFFDIGGGNGYVTSGLESLGIETVLVEPGTRGIKNAKIRNVKHLACATLENAGFKENSLSNIGLFDVVEHIQYDVDFLRKVHSYMTADGNLFITVPAYNFLWSHEDISAGHYRRHTLNSIQSRLMKSGFSVIFRSYFFCVLPFPIFLFRSLPYRLGMKKLADARVNQKKDHDNKGIAATILNNILRFELKRLKKGKSLLFGGSCMVIAQKI